MRNSIQGQDLYKVRLLSTIPVGLVSDSAEYYFDVSDAVMSTNFAVYVDFSDDSKKDIIEIHRTSLGGTRLHYYQYRRSNVGIQHEISSFVQINSMAWYREMLAKNVDNLGWVRKNETPGLNVFVFGGKLQTGTGYIDVSSEIILLSNNTTSYIYIDQSTNDFAISTTELSNVYMLAKVITSGGDITSIEDYRSLGFGVNIPASMTEIERDALNNVKNGFPIYNTTSGTLQYYNGGVWYDIPVSGGVDPTQRMSETVEGKARLTNNTEFTNGTDIGGSGEPLVSKPSQIKTALDNIVSQDIPAIIDSSFIAGESISSGNSVFYEEIILESKQNSYQNIGSSTSNKRVFVKRLGSGTSGNTIEFFAEKIGSPASNLNFRIEGTDINGKPNGNLLDVDGIASVDKDGTRGGANTHGITLGSPTVATASTYGVRIVADNDIIITSVTKIGSSAVTRVLIFSNAGLIATQNFVGDVATLSTPIFVRDGESVRIECDGGGSTSVVHYINSSPTLPQVSSNITYVSGSAVGDSTTFGDILSVSTMIKKTITLNDNITIPKGTPFGIVMYQGTYGSEIESSTAYYRIGAASINTNSLYGGTYNGSIYSINNNMNIYVNSVLAENTVVSKTSALYTYKFGLNTLISSEDYSVGENVRTESIGYTKKIDTSSFSNGDILYLSDTHGLLNNNIGTNNICAGIVLKDNVVYLDADIPCYGTTYQYSLNSTARTAYNTNTSWIKVKETLINDFGSFSVTYDRNKNTSYVITYAVFKNGLQIGPNDIMATGSGSGYVGQSNPVLVNCVPGDIIQIYGKCTDAATTIQVQNVYIKYSKRSLPIDKGTSVL